MMMKKILSLFVITAPNLLYADEPRGIGKVAVNLLDPVSIVSDFLGSASIIIGACCLFGSLLKYMQHRTNPHMAPMSTVITLLVMGIVLVCLPFVYLLTGYGIPYSLF